MKEYEKFDEYLQLSKIIMRYCYEREERLSQYLCMGLEADQKIFLLDAVGKEMIDVVDFLNKLKKDVLKNFASN